MNIKSSTRVITSLSSLLSLQAISNESVKYRDLVSKICDKAKEILPQLSDVDQTLLADKIKNINDQFQQ